MRSLAAIWTTAMLVVAAAWGWVAATPTPQPLRPVPRPLSEIERAQLPPPLADLLPHHRPLSAPRPGEWLDRHVETGQNYRQYAACDPIRARRDRRTIYVQPLGVFAPAERQVVVKAGEFLGYAFQLPVRVLDDIRLDALPPSARRIHPEWGVPQVLVGYLLDEVLKPRLPDDAVTYIGLTPADLWTGEGSNFVFGYASLADRVGVWSIHRFGDPAESDEAFQACLLRTMKISAHETGHMFSLAHCVHYDCVMNGVNHLAELDGRPAAFCPLCLAKIVYATGADPRRHFEACAGFAEANGLRAEAALWRWSSETIDAAAQ